MKKNKKHTKEKMSSLEKMDLIPISLKQIIQRRNFAIILSLLFFLLMLGISFSYHKIGDYGVETDFYWAYTPEAKQILNGTVTVSPFRGPIYPIVLAFVHMFFGEFFKSGIFISVLSGSLVILFTYQTMKRLYSNGIALLAALFLMLNPIFIQYSYTAGTDMFFNALITCILYLLLTTSSFNWPRLIGIGILSGVAYLTRYNGIFIIFAIPIVVCLINPMKLDVKKRILFCAVFLLIFFLTISPWGILCLKEKGDFFYNQNYRNIAFELYGKGKMSWDEFWFGNKMNITSFTDILFRNPKLFITKIMHNIPDHFINDMKHLIGWYIGLFVIVGMLSFMKNRPTPLLWTYFIFNLFFFGVLLSVFYGQRFSLFLIPFYTILALQIFIIIQHKKTSYIRPARIVLILLLAVTLIRSYQFNSQNIQSGPKEILSIAKWFKSNIPKNSRGTTISARKPHIAYYLDLTFVRIPLEKSYEDLIAALKRKKIDYLYFGMIEASTRNELQFLLDPRYSSTDLKPIVYTRRPPSVLYEIQYDTTKSNAD